MTLKLSIWQQFGSNHSSFFTIVGGFEGHDQAKAAYNELRLILFEIDRWHREHLDESRQLVWDPYPTPVENEIAARYGVEWLMRIDWADWGLYHLRDSTDPVERAQGERAAELAAAEIDRTVSVIGNLVFVADPDATWMIAEPFATILRRLGATRVLALDWPTEETDDEELRARLKGWRIGLVCAAPDETQAEALTDLIRAYLDDADSWHKPPPWNDYESNLGRAARGASVLDPRQAEALLANEARLLESIDPSARRSHRKTRVSVETGTVIRQGRELVIELPMIPALTFAALVVYLENSGCRDLKFTLIGQEIKLI